MGMRQNIELTYSDGNKIYLYSHWGGDELGKGLDTIVKKALARHERWDDEAYLARIIFSELVKNEIDSETGYGLAPYPIYDEYPLIKVNLSNKTVNEVPFQDFINNGLTK